MQIDSNDPIVKQSLQSIADLIILNGGEIHSKLTIHHRNERLWISCDAPIEGVPILIVPDELFVPVTQLEWHGRNGVLEFEGSTENLSIVQNQLLDAMLVIYNRSGKVLNIADKLPAQKLKQDSELLTWFQSAHSAFILPKDNSARQFIGTRLNEKPSNEDPDVQIGYLMPLIDYLNHHPYGSKYERTESGAWRIPLLHPVLGSRECYVRYSKSDSLSIAMWHGYFDPYTRHIASVDCKLQHTELGEVYIRGTNASRRKINAPRLLLGEPILTLQDLVLEKEQLQPLRTLLGLAVRSKRRDLKQLEAEIIANDLIQLLTDANIQKYSELRELCRRELEHFPLRPLFGQVADHQLSLLHTMQIG